MSISIQVNRRVIGPIPPRDKKTGRLSLAPLLGKHIKLNLLGEPVRDDKGQPVEEVADLRDKRDYLIWEQGMEPDESAIKGLRMYEIDLPAEPLVRVYARDEADAVHVYKREMGIVRFGQEDPKIKEIAG